MRLHQPLVDGQEVVVGWEVTPSTELYRRTSFRLTFPANLDLRPIPHALWCRIAMICLYTHWALLRPCRVELPFALDQGEREFWLRLIDDVVVQLEAYGSAPRQGRAVDLVTLGSRSASPPPPPARAPADGDRVAVSFSGGKDSLVLAALAAEITPRPLLVSITSPVPWARDHVGAARTRVFDEIPKRLTVDVAQVHSDYRTCWNLDFAARDGCTLGVHELSDISLFQGATAAVAAATGSGRMLMASEADIQYNAEQDHRVLLHREFLSCAVTQGALDALLWRFGLRQGSLTFPLHMPQVQALLLTRYRAIADLQFSCWQAPEGAQACGTCDKCFEIALIALAEGVSPRVIGIDPLTALLARIDWRPDSPRKRTGPALHAFRTPRHQIIRPLQQTPTERVASVLDGDPVARDDVRVTEALAVYARMRAQALTLVVPPAPGYIAGFLELVHSDLREPLRAILDQYFTPAAADEFDGIVTRARALTAWIAQPLAGRTS